MTRDASARSRIILAGHSHAVAMGLKFLPKTEPEQLVAIPDRAGAFAFRGNPRQDRYWERLAAQARDSIVLLVWAGNQHLVHFLLARSASFDFHLARHPDLPLDAKAMLVPEALVRATMYRALEALPLVLRRLKDAGCTPVVLGTPAPKADDRKLLGFLRRDAHTIKGGAALGGHLDAAAITPPAIRRKLWIVVQDLLEEASRKEDCQFIPVPTASMDAAGFLKADYWSPDLSHANKAYGDLFWADIERALENR